MVAVTGKVTFNGQPLTAGSIYLHPDATNKFQKDSPSSQLQLDGTVTFKTYPFGDGVPLGKYKVTLAPALASRIGRPDYSNVEKTPWVLEVTESGVDGHEFIVK